MDARNRLPGHGRDPEVLLRVSEHFLRRRHFEDCRKYALDAQQADPNLSGLPQILAISDVLRASGTLISETNRDWYSILQLNYYSHDFNLIRERFNNLLLLLNPSTNKFPFADEAVELVREAWYVLSNPLKKSEFDIELNNNQNDNGPRNNCEKMKGNFDKKGDSFWTVCPYCYYVYEYARLHEDCCLRCPNDKCAKAFHGVEIQRPPVDVLRNGKYLCSGFLPVGFKGGEGNPSSTWNPFTPKKYDNVVERENFVEISDDSDSSFADEFYISATRVEAGEVNESGDGFGRGQRSNHMEVPTIVKPAMKRKKKSVARNTKKLMGTGYRVKRQELAPQSSEDSDTDGQAGDADVGTGSGFVRGIDMAAKDEQAKAEVEFFDGDDDIFVSLQDGI